MNKRSLNKSAGCPYIVLIMDWTGTGAHWIKGFHTFQEAQNAVLVKQKEHKEIGDRVIIVKGEIKQLGFVQGNT